MRALISFFTSAAGIGFSGWNCIVPDEVAKGAASGNFRIRVELIGKKLRWFLKAPNATRWPCSL